MPSIVVVGAQWGDEGKGKVVDYLARDAHVVARYQGGNNAGHTIVVGAAEYKFHLLPSGMLHEGKLCVLGNGVVVDLEQLVRELDDLEAKGIATERFRLSARAHVLLPTHALLDQRAEAAKGTSKIGTTGRGVGPAYRDKVSRAGLRVADLADTNEVEAFVARHLADHARALGDEAPSAGRLVASLRTSWARLSRYVCDASLELNGALDRGERVLFEGAQGTLLDIDHGTYPFVTSSSPTAGGACIGAGVGPTRIGGVVGVTKAYATRVGGGPFPSELLDATGEALRSIGREFGTTTGRARRCGWLDVVALRYAIRVNGMTSLAITKLDVLDGFPELAVCTGYRIGGRVTVELPDRVRDLERAEPIWETHRGWSEMTSAARSWATLPSEARTYLARLEELLGVPVSIVSVGADRDATFSRLPIWEQLAR